MKIEDQRTFLKMHLEIEYEDQISRVAVRQNPRASSPGRSLRFIPKKFKPGRSFTNLDNHSLIVLKLKEVQTWAIILHFFDTTEYFIISWCLRKENTLSSTCDISFARLSEFLFYWPGCQSGNFHICAVSFFYCWL